ncbi:MAG TPA: hypothetical protein PKY96_16045, partial [Flavobacteriales bacterium]|nr:hypothetical protein [Flavobacteriales bacterium]
VRWSGVDAGFKYFESWQLRRADDAVARLQYALGPGKWVIQPGLLAIVHIGEDEHLTYPDMFNGNVAPFPVRERMAGSDGLTLNITADARYRLNDAWVMEASFGSPVIVREVRPDGLTRSMVLNLGARFSF